MFLSINYIHFACEVLKKFALTMKWFVKRTSFCILIKVLTLKEEILTDEVKSGSTHVFGFFSHRLQAAGRALLNTSIPEPPFSARI